MQGGKREARGIKRLGGSIRRHFSDNRTVPPCLSMPTIFLCFLRQCLRMTAHRSRTWHQFCRMARMSSWCGLGRLPGAHTSGRRHGVSGPPGLLLRLLPTLFISWSAPSSGSTVSFAHRPRNFFTHRFDVAVGIGDGFEGVGDVTILPAAR